jgi:hypothetical protein
VFFFEKKNQKTFASLFPRKVTGYAQGDEGDGAKVFWFFFSKKNTFFLMVASAAPPPQAG